MTIGIYQDLMWRAYPTERWFKAVLHLGDGTIEPKSIDPIDPPILASGPSSDIPPPPPAPPHVTLWLGILWIGLPWPLRLRPARRRPFARALGVPLPGLREIPAPGCGCILLLKRITTAIRSHFAEPRSCRSCSDQDLDIIGKEASHAFPPQLR